MRRNSAAFIAVGAVAMTILAGISTSLVGIERYVDARTQAEQDLARYTLSSEASVTDGQDIRRSAVAVIRHAQSELDQAVGHTLDDTAAQSVRVAAHTAQVALDDVGLQIRTVSSTASNIQATAVQALSWPPNLTAMLKANRTPLDVSDASAALQRLRTAVVTLNRAEQLWQVEQNRIAAEQAAAAARTASFGGQSESISDASTQSSIETFLSDFGANANVQWVEGLCASGRVCGITNIGNGTPTIQLDPNALGRYLGYSGKYVLVHEAAHARSWYRYGSLNALYAGSEAVMTNGLQAKQAVEYMADCATIVRLGYSVGTYTSSCTPEQLAEAATYW